MRQKSTVEIAAAAGLDGGSLASKPSLDSLTESWLWGMSKMRVDHLRSLVCVGAVFCALPTLTHAQTQQTQQTQQKADTARQGAASTNSEAPVLPKGYVIGPEDVLSI